MNSQMPLLILLFILCYVFGNFGQTLLGIPNAVLLYFLLGYALLMMAFRKNFLSDMGKWTLCIVIGSVLMLSVRFATGILQESVQSTLILILPALLVSLFPKNGLESLVTKITVSRFLRYFYLIECSLAVMEFVFRQHLFGWVDVSYEKGIVNYSGQDFRSVSLCGSPLNNALVVTILMLFLLFDNTIPLWKKTFPWFLGLAAVFCFNARAAIVINLLGMLLYAGKEAFKSQSSSQFKYMALLVFVCIVVSVFFMLGIGSRLVSTSSVFKDGSMNVRYKLFKYFFNTDLQNYIWGHSLADLRHIAKHIGVKVVENFWIICIYHFGIVFTAYFTFCYFKLAKGLLKPYPAFDKIVIPVLVVALMSINNSVASNYMPLFIFLLCCYTNQLKRECPASMRIFQIGINNEKKEYPI